jgi:hypothetical protein
MFALMDEGLLVRDMSHDNDPMWAVRQIKFVQRLCEANAAMTSHKRDADHTDAGTGKAIR